MNKLLNISEKNASTLTMSSREIAELCEMDLTDLLRSDILSKSINREIVLDKFLYRQSGNLLPYQKSQERGLFTVKTGTAEHGHNFTQTRVTSKGIEFIASRYASELMQ
ncbi:antirepressor protein 1 [[Actinobacillus] rossii]|uniref:Antirepressor protein 1 n=1 Tax=[Actinobacillus] rossii TaxID=123820 RepID=A0A380TZN1_9PAST|nr:antirepressor protein 1 [[Actinobacillus] rossii]